MAQDNRSRSLRIGSTALGVLAAVGAPLGAGRRLRVQRVLRLEPVREPRHGGARKARGKGGGGPPGHGSSRQGATRPDRRPPGDRGRRIGRDRQRRLQQPFPPRRSRCPPGDLQPRPEHGGAHSRRHRGGAELGHPASGAEGLGEGQGHRQRPDPQRPPPRRLRHPGPGRRQHARRDAHPDRHRDRRRRAGPVVGAGPPPLRLAVRDHGRGRRGGADLRLPDRPLGGLEQRRGARPQGRRRGRLGHLPPRPADDAPDRRRRSGDPARGAELGLQAGGPRGPGRQGVAMGDRPSPRPRAAASCGRWC